jgi:hypothetical protein
MSFDEGGTDVSKRIVILCLTILLVLPAAPVAARRGEPTPHQPVPIAGVIRPGAPVLHLDVNAPWLLAQPIQHSLTYRRIAPAEVVEYRMDAVAPWLVRVAPTTLCLRGERFSGMVDLGSDRMHGLLDTTWATDIRNEMVGANATYTVNFHLATPAGHWEGLLTGYGESIDGPAHLHGLLVGDGDFSGDSAVLELTRSAADSGWTVAGTIY